jgi:hypothetical protein
MSVAIVVKVSEGLVLGADSAATISGRILGPQGPQEGVLKTFYNAKKLMQVGDLPIGVLTWGIGQLGMRTLESLVREWEHDQHWQSYEEYRSHHSQDESNIEVRGCAVSLHDHLQRVYSEIPEFRELPPERRPGLGVVVAGYSENAFFPDIWRFAIPFDQEVQNARPDRDGHPDFGASWFGATDAIIRLHWGRAEEVMRILSERFGIAEEDIKAALEPLQYQVPFGVMPLQDAIEYAYYMINVTIGRYRFVIGPELCGGEVDVAAITQGKFVWISQKSWTLGHGGRNVSTTNI